MAPLSLALSHTPKVVEKSDAARARIRTVIKHSFLLKGGKPLMYVSDCVSIRPLPVEYMALAA